MTCGVLMSNISAIFMIQTTHCIRPLKKKKKKKTSLHSYYHPFDFLLCR